MSTFLVRTHGLITREGPISAPTREQATRKAIVDHRKRLVELARNTTRLGSDERKAVLLATTRSILVSNVEVIDERTPQVGDTFTPQDAA